MSLTFRSKKIILLLLEEDDYITVGNIALCINVSTRTVLRELIYIENWLSKNEIFLEKKKGIGVRIKIEQNESNKLRDCISMEKADMTHSPEQRLTLLKIELLKTQGITKLYSLTRLLDVTESTISSDIDKLVIWMKKYGLKVIKKPGLGIYVEGKEIAFRSALIALIYEQFHEAELINIIFRQEKDNINYELIKYRMSQDLLDIVDIKNIEIIDKLLHNIEKQFNVQFADNSYIALVLRISITIHRCKEGNFINGNDDLKVDTPKDKLYVLVKEWLISHTDPLQFLIPDEEIKYMVIHIKGAEVQEKHNKNHGQDGEEQKIKDLVKEVIFIAERETGIYLEDNEKFVQGLVGHLRTAMYRIRMHLDIMNPLLEDIKIMYPDLFRIAGICAKFIEENEDINIPDDELAYLAAHIGAAVKEQKSNTIQLYHAVVVCTNDIGAAHLLVSEIEQVFPNIQISSIISVMDMDITQLAQKNIDLIITTVDLQITEIPYILVNTILNEADKQQIRDILENFLPENMNYGRIKTAQLDDKLNKLKHYSNYLLQILHNFLYIEQIAVKKLSDLNHFFCQSLMNRSEDRIKLEKDLKNIEKKGSAILSQKGIVLYHCKSEVVKELGITTLRLKNSINSMLKDNEKEKADTFIFLSMPLTIDSYAMEILNEVTRRIISGDFAMVLKQCGKEEVTIELNMILDNLIQNKVLDIK